MTELLEDRSTSRDTKEQSIRFESCPKRVRVRFAGVVVADSRRVLTMFETSHLPVYYFPIEDVRTDLTSKTGHSTRCAYKGDASYYSVTVGDKTAENAIWRYEAPLDTAPSELAGRMAFYWGKMDAWFEEDDEVYVHPRDPYKRIDVLNSSRHVQVHVAGECVADTARPRLLFETNLPTRYYIPRLDVRLELLERSPSSSRCPYKGVAEYFSVRIGENLVTDIVWSYPLPIPECPKIENLMCFYNEKVDIYVDGELIDRPSTPWS
ncbi:MAG: DUF427 domain-containing protein [Acidimicrobiales bacterium]